MRYNLELLNSIPTLVPVYFIIHGNMKISNPSDELVDSLGLGYPFIKEPEPSYDTSTQRVTWGYVQEQTQIVERGFVEDLTQEEIDAKLNEHLDAQIYELNVEFETWKKSPGIIYQGHAYQPSWLAEYYVPMLQDESSFPRAVWTLDGAYIRYSLEDFRLLVTTMGNEIQVKTNTLWNSILALEEQRPAVVEA